MRKIILIVAVAATVAACSAVTRTRVYMLESTYGVALAQAVALRKLPLCKTGQTSTLASVCMQRSFILSLQAADRNAQTAMAVLKQLADTNLPFNAPAAVQAESAVNNFSALAASQGAVQ